MSVKIRLAKVGKKHQISYRIVACDTHAKRDGRFLEILGHFDPREKRENSLNKERVAYWIQKGAKPTETVAKILKQSVGDSVTQ